MGNQKFNIKSYRSLERAYFNKKFFMKCADSYMFWITEQHDQM